LLRSKDEALDVFKVLRLNRVTMWKTT